MLTFTCDGLPAERTEVALVSCNEMRRAGLDGSQQDRPVLFGQSDTLWEVYPLRLIHGRLWGFASHKDVFVESITLDARAK